jgi:hypothetical protein
MNASSWTIGRSRSLRSRGRAGFPRQGSYRPHVFVSGFVEDDLLEARSESVSQDLLQRRVSNEVLRNPLVEPAGARSKLGSASGRQGRGATARRRLRGWLRNCRRAHRGACSVGLGHAHPAPAPPRDRLPRSRGWPDRQGVAEVVDPPMLDARGCERRGPAAVAEVVDYGHLVAVKRLRARVPRRVRFRPGRHSDATGGPRCGLNASPRTRKAPRVAELSRPTGATGLEPATSGVTGRRSNRLSYAPQALARG